MSHLACLPAVSDDDDDDWLSNALRVVAVTDNATLLVPFDDGGNACLVSHAADDKGGQRIATMADCIRTVQAAAARFEADMEARFVPACVRCLTACAC